MNRVYILLIQQLCTVFLCATNVQSQEVVLRTNAVDTVNVNSMYKYPGFLQGTLYYRNGDSATGRFNINMLLDEIQFISLKGDTLSLADENIIDNIVMGDHILYYSKGVIEVVKNYKLVQLGMNRKVIVQASKPRGFYGESLEFRSVTSYGQFISNNQSYKLEENKNALLTKATGYYFIKDDKSVILPATKNNLYKILREHNQKELSDYLSGNKINFKKEEDLCKLLSFCERFARNE